MMFREEIREDLSGSERWGCNDQPYLEEVVDTLFALPVMKIYMDDDATMIVEMERSLTASEAFHMAYWLRADEPDSISNHQTLFRFWWD